MYSTTIKSDGQLRQATPPAKPAPTPPPAPHPRPTADLLTPQNLLILAVAFLLLQNKKPDWLLLAALAYLLF